MTEDEEIMGSSLGFATLRGLLAGDASGIGRMSTKHSTTSTHEGVTGAVVFLAASQCRALMGVPPAVVRGMRKVHVQWASR
jgi:hypothetical protein